MKRTVSIIIVILSIVHIPAQNHHIFSVDEAREEWTLMFILDTQGYIENWISNERYHNFVQAYQCQDISKDPSGLMEIRYFVFKPIKT